jgi:WD40 repeat protein
LEIFDLSDDAMISRQEWDPGIGEVHSIAWSPDGHWVALGARYATTVRLWDVHTGGIGPNFPGGATTSGAVVAWSPDGTRIAVGSRDRTTRIWDFQTQDPLWIGVTVSEDAVATFSGAGELLHADPLAEQQLVYLVETSHSKTDVLTLDQFRERVAKAQTTP